MNRIRVVLLATLLATLPAGPALAQRVKVLRVTDGDTFQIGVRLIGIDTPETRHPRKPIEFFGKEASAFHRKLIKGKTVRLELGRRPADRYGRLLAYVFLSDGNLLNALLVSQGYARASPYPPNLKYRELFRELERKARARRKGMWSRGPQDKRARESRRPPVLGNRKTRVYHLPGGLYYDLMLRSKYRKDFTSESEAIQKKYQKSLR